MLCSWLKSANQFDQFNMVCDLSKTRTFCGGLQAHCECPELLAADWEVEYDQEKQKEIDAHGEWVDLCEEARYIQTGR